MNQAQMVFQAHRYMPFCFQVCKLIFLCLLELHNKTHFDLIFRQTLTLEQTSLDLALEEQARSQTTSSLIIMVKLLA